jgi:hypothetical protein
MSLSETEEHSKLKETLRIKLAEWFKGVTLKEYMVAGYEADVYGVTQDKKIIHIEIIWSPGQYTKNMISLLISDAHAKIAVFSSSTLRKFQRDYSKVRLEQLKKGFYFSRPIDGTRILENDVSYIKAVHKEIIRIIERFPPEISPTFPRFYWFMNEELIRKVTHSLGEKKWEDYPSISQISLLGGKHVVDLEEINHEIGIRQEDWEPIYIEELDWSKKKKLLRLFGRFYAPFGVKDETITQFVLDPCYLSYKRSYSLNVHIQQNFIRSDLESGTIMGLDRWQKPSIFVVGLLKHLQPWQPYVIEPLVMYTSEEESQNFHLKLIEKTGRMERQETYFEPLAEKYGIKKAEKLEDIINRELEEVFYKNCWEDQPRAPELENLYGTVAELVNEKDEADALTRILTIASLSSLEDVRRTFEESKSQLIEFKEKYKHLLLEMLRELDSNLNLDHLISNEIGFHELVFKILEKGKIRIKKTRKIHNLPIAEVKVILSLNGAQKEIVIGNLDMDELKILEALSKESK